MSRSRKKPYVTIGGKGWFRKYHNRCLRRKHWSVEIPSGRAFRKFRNPWDIIDHCWRIREPEMGEFLAGFLRWGFKEQKWILEWWEKDWRNYYRAFRK